MRPSPTGPTLRGPRALLRPISRDDRAALAAILAEPDVARWWIHGDLESTVAGLYDEPGSVPLTIEVDGEVVGYIQFSEDLDPDYRRGAIDLFLSAAWQGRGLGPRRFAWSPATSSKIAATTGSRSTRRARATPGHHS